MSLRPLDGVNKIPEFWLAPIWGWLVYALIYFAFCFQPKILRSDDFGYFRSIIGTLQSGRLYTYEWLAPFNAFFTSACVLLFRVTGNLYLSTFGFQVLCVLAFYPLLYLLLVKRLQPKSAALAALLTATFPLFLVKAGDFHGSLCTLDLFLTSLLLFEVGKIGWFFLAAFAAYANRQNQICLLILPLSVVFDSIRHREKIPWQIAVGGFGYAIGATILFLFMNRTYAMANAVFQSSGIGANIVIGAGAILGGIFVTLGIMSVFSIWARPSLRIPVENRKRWLPVFCICLAFLAFVPFWQATLIKTDTPFFGLLGWPQVNHILPWLILPLLWHLNFRLLKPSPYLLLIGGYILMASLRGIWWDYYFMEIILLCLLLNWKKSEKEVGDLGIPAVGWWMAAVVLTVNITYGYLLKVTGDKQQLIVPVMERLEREGRITVDCMTGATFGYLGWKLFDYFLANEGKEYGNLEDFLGYIRRDRVVIDTYLPWRRSFKAALPEGAELLDTGYCRIGFIQSRYRVVDLHGPRAGEAAMGRFMTLDPVRFHSPRFPLNNREWEELIKSSPKR